MADFGPPPRKITYVKPDSRIFASYPMPAKIDLINERPRRESVIEKQLAERIEVKTPNEHESSAAHSTSKPTSDQQHVDQQVRFNKVVGSANQEEHLASVRTEQQPFASPSQLPINHKETARQNRSATNKNNSALLAAELAEKEAKLMAEINSLHQRPYSPFQIPDKIDLATDQRNASKQSENAPSSRPDSRVSSNRSTSADLFDKETKLLQEIEEMERKPYNPQTIIVEREQWYEYPADRPNDRHLMDSKRRVRDFCSLPSHMYPNQDRHIHEENLPAIGRPSSATSSIHTAIIRVPSREIDNKSPLLFAFDNFSTKGVRGNIASAGAIEPERPRAPIYPIVKRTPSPNMARG